MQWHCIALDIPEGANIVFGQTHFIKTVEDLYEIMVTSVPEAKFGIAFCEASGACLIRKEGNDPDLIGSAVRNAQSVGCGHSFFVVMKNAFPVNVLSAIKACAEVCHIFCATANPVQVIVVETEQGRGVMGVVDGFSSKGIEKDDDAQWRKDFLRKIGYKL